MFSVGRELIVKRYESLKCFRYSLIIWRVIASLFPWKKTVIKKMIFRLFSAADGQMSIQLTYLNRAFHALSIDMSHDHKHVFLILGWLPPPWGGSRVIPGKFWFMIWKYKSEPISMKKISFLSHSVWTCSPEKNSYKKNDFPVIFSCWRSNEWSKEHSIDIFE